MKKKAYNKKKRIKFSFFLTKEIIIVISLLLLALIFRLIYLSHLKANDPGFYNLPLGTDMVTYDNQAQDILKGKHPAPYYYGPLYPYFLAIIYFVFGRDFYVARLANHLFGVLTCLFIFLIAKRVFSKKVAYVALVLSILYRMFPIHEGLLLLEALFAFLNTGAIFFLLLLERQTSLKNIILSSLFFALAMLTRANILAFIPFILIWMAIVFKKRTLWLFPIFLGFIFLFIMPATIMNYIKAKKFILISTSGPVNLWIGNNEYANGEYQVFPLSKRLEKRIKEVGDKAFIENVIKFAKEKPQAFIKLLITKFLLFWSSLEIANNMNYDQMKNCSPLLKLPFFIGFGIIAPFGLFGIFLSLRRKESLILHLFILSFVLSTVAIFVLERYKIGFIPILIIFSSFSIIWFYEGIIKRGYGKILLLLPIFISFIILVWWFEIYGKLIYPMSHPKGIYVKTEGGLVIKDYKNKWQGDNGSIALSSPYILLKKELYILDNPNDYKMASLIFDFSPGNPPGILVVDINGNGFDVPLPSSQATYSSIKFPPKWLIKGKNTITIKAKETSLSITSIPIDREYCFGRSFIKTNGEWKKIKSGELIIRLELERTKKSLTGKIEQI